MFELSARCPVRERAAPSKRARTPPAPVTPGSPLNQPAGWIAWPWAFQACESTLSTALSLRPSPGSAPASVSCCQILVSGAALAGAYQLRACKDRHGDTPVQHWCLPMRSRQQRRGRVRDTSAPCAWCTMSWAGCMAGSHGACMHGVEHLDGAVDDGRGADDV
jgi:hypothetical protein